jgi:transposase
MSNVLANEKREQVLALGRLAWPLRRIEQATGVRRETASAYLKAAGIPVREPRRRGLPKPASETATDSGPDPSAIVAPARWPAAPGRAPQASACEPHREWILQALARGRNAMAIWQDLVDRHGFTARYGSVKRFVSKLQGARPIHARAVIVTAPGEEAQVDYGTGPMVRDPATGKYRRTRLFVLVLGYSRKAVRLLTFGSSVRIWAELHERAFRVLGGAPHTIVLDNLREGVLAPDVYDPTVNPLYRDVLAHYGAVALPCRVRDPDRKGKVESGVGHAKRTALAGLRFESLEATQAHLDHWEERWADTRIHGTTKRQVAAMFAEERPALLPLPLAPFRYYQHGSRTVHLDGCVEVEAAYYSAPPGWIGRTVSVQWDALRVRLLDAKTSELLREHVKSDRGRHRIHDDDRSPRTPPGATQLLARAERAGTQIGALCAEILRRESQSGIRRVLGVLALARRNGPSAVDDACKAALELRVPTYRFVRRYLERRPAPPLALRQVDPLIRALSEYRDHIEQLTKTQGDTP